MAKDSDSIVWDSPDVYPFEVSPEKSSHNPTLIDWKLCKAASADFFLSGFIELLPLGGVLEPTNSLLPAPILFLAQASPTAS